MCFVTKYNDNYLTYIQICVPLVMYMCIVSNKYRIGKVRIEYVSYWLLTVSSQPYCSCTAGIAGLQACSKNRPDSSVMHQQAMPVEHAKVQASLPAADSHQCLVVTWLARQKILNGFSSVRGD